MNAIRTVGDANEWVPPAAFARHALADCDDVYYLPAIQNRAAADASFSILAAQTDWIRESIAFFGRSVAVPRCCAWYGDAGVSYDYSRLHHRAAGWTLTTASLRDVLFGILGVRFNFVLLNLYRDGNDRMGWHSDDERELGPAPCIASLSFGAPRRFCLRSRDARNRRAQVWLEPGSLLVMCGASQRNWLHSLPAARECRAPRINLTFRLVRTGG